MESDVCKHCTHAGCLDVCPTGALFRTEFGTVVVQEDICNGCGYCVPACPFGVLDKRDLPRSPDDAPLALPLLGRKEDGRVWKCTLCYDRLKGGHEPACAKACPTESIQFGELDELRERAEARLAKLEAERWNGPRLYGHDPATASAGSARSSCCSTSPRCTGCRPTRSCRPRTCRDCGSGPRSRPTAMVAGIAAVFVGGRSMNGRSGWSSGSITARRHDHGLLLRAPDREGARLAAGDPLVLLHRRGRRRLLGAPRSRAARPGTTGSRSAASTSARRWSSSRRSCSSRTWAGPSGS